MYYYYDYKNHNYYENRGKATTRLGSRQCVIIVY